MDPNLGDFDVVYLLLGFECHRANKADGAWRLPSICSAKPQTQGAEGPLPDVLSASRTRGGGGGGFINGYRPERENETVSVALDEQVDIAACLAVTSGQG